MLLGLDVGKTGARAIAIDDAGMVVASANAGYASSMPRPGWVEQDPHDWWAAAQLALGRVVAELGADRDTVSALGLSGQMGGAIFLDGRSEVIRPALVGNDARAVAQCAQIEQRVGLERLVESVGNRALPGSQAAKILWLRDVEPVQYRHVRRVLLPKDYVRLRLTGEVATDASDASGTLLLDLRKRRWSGEVLDALEIPCEWLPSVSESPVVTGGLRPSVAAELGLPVGLPVAAGAGDVASAAVGAAVMASGLTSSSLDDGSLLVSSGERLLPDRSGRLQVWCSPIAGRYLVVGLVPAAGRALRWWEDVVGGVGCAELVAGAEAVAAGDDGLFFLSPVDGDLISRGAFVGLRADHRREHLTWALMEGVTLSMRDPMELMQERGIDVQQVRAIGLESRARRWCQLKADIFNLSVATIAVDEGPAFGAALLSGVAVGVYPDVSGACEAAVRVAEVFEPDAKRATRYAEIAHTYRALRAAVGEPTNTRLTPALAR